MFTFSYRWRPWPSDTALADGPLILDYVRTVAREHRVDELIRYHHRVTAASWDSETARWTVTIDRDGETITMTTELPVGLLGLLRLRAGLRAGVPRRRGRSAASCSTRSTGPTTSTTPASASS